MLAIEQTWSTANELRPPLWSSCLRAGGGGGCGGQIIWGVAAGSAAGRVKRRADGARDGAFPWLEAEHRVRVPRRNLMLQQRPDTDEHFDVHRALE